MVIFFDFVPFEGVLAEKSETAGLQTCPACPSPQKFA
jgi:hypothetical protein